MLTEESPPLDIKNELLSEFGDAHINKWEKVEIPDLDYVLFYFPIKGVDATYSGFYFYCVEKETWDENDNCIDYKCVFYGVGYDRVRHLYFGDKQANEYGYLYYPKINSLMLMLKELRKLEKKYCWDVE